MDDIAIADANEIKLTDLAPHRQVEYHKDATGGANDNIAIDVGHEPSGGAPWQYGLTYNTPDGPLTDEIIFCHGPCEGLTNEALLAVVLDRLNCFQAGGQPCQENNLARGQVQSALDLLRARAVRVARAVSQPEPSMVEPKAPRISVTSTALTIAATTFDLDLLRRAWGAWNTVEDALKKLTPPATPEEWAVLDAIATTNAAKNGLAEVRSALGRMGK